MSEEPKINVSRESRDAVRRTLQDGKDDQGRIWLSERCKSSRCKGRRNCVGFHVDDDVWMAVVGDENAILCPQCFDELAQEKGIKYDVRETYHIPWWVDQIPPGEEWRNHRKESPKPLDSASWDTGRMAVHIKLVSRGVRPVAEIMVPVSEADKLANEAIAAGLRVIRDERGTTHVALYMFKHDYLKHIINHSLGKGYDQDVVQHWVAGKMFGYSEEEIGDFVD